MALQGEGSLAQALSEIRHALDSIAADYALIGGLAVSAWAEPRTTRDVDLAVSLLGDSEAEALIHDLREFDYSVVTLVEQVKTHRLATARLRNSNPKKADLIIDLLFASSGIEPEIVASAIELEILPKVFVKVASVGHLLAMKVLARDDRSRPQDYDDIRALLAVATARDLSTAADGLRLIQARGFGRKRQLERLWKKALRELDVAARPPKS